MLYLTSVKLPTTILRVHVIQNNSIMNHIQRQLFSSKRSERGREKKVKNHHCYGVLPLKCVIVQYNHSGNLSALVGEHSYPHVHDLA